MRRAAWASIAAAAAMLVALPAPGAHAAAYRYWTYWQAAPAGWQFATAGPAFTLPEDGSVEGWRFAVTSEGGTAEAMPSMAPDFEVICGSTSPVPGSKRIALVVDSGVLEHAPSGQSPSPLIAECVVADADATGYQVLRSVAEVRSDNGLICAIAGYPAGECAPVVEALAPENAGQSEAPIVTHASAEATAAPASPAGPTSSGPWATIAVIALAAAGVIALIARRRRG